MVDSWPRRSMGNGWSSRQPNPAGSSCSRATRCSPSHARRMPATNSSMPPPRSSKPSSIPAISWRSSPAEISRIATMPDRYLLANAPEAIVCDRKAMARALSASAPRSTSTAVGRNRAGRSLRRRSRLGRCTVRGLAGRDMGVNSTPPICALLRDRPPAGPDAERPRAQAGSQHRARSLRSLVQAALRRSDFSIRADVTTRARPRAMMKSDGKSVSRKAIVRRPQLRVSRP